MKTLSVRELRSAMPTLEETLALEGEVLLVSKGRPIARLLPPSPEPARPRLPSLKAFRATLPRQDIPSEEPIRQDRDRRGR